MARHRHLPHLRFSALAALGAATCAVIAGDATAQWPPAESLTATDMAKPENWPNDPDYGYDQDRDGQWNYYSFLPTQMGGSTLRPEEKVSGMSIDLAWRYTQGDDSVVIAVMDSGIRWSHDDLIDRAWLNRAELANHKPTKADGSACGGTGDLAGFDCNEDGIFSASDYAESPIIEPQAAEGVVHGDKNRNGWLDAGDLILNFSDGIDDDGNGYVDDISGWDFMKQDNNPFDDTDYGHGTGEARDSVAEGNNGRGGIGGCHECRFMAMRVGDSFIADVNAFAQGVIYATDNGARVVQCALGTVNMNNFAQAALTYAHQHNVLNITSMADENARHHNMPATANHTLPVHAIQFSPTNRVTNAETFVDFNPCTNFGGQNLLSVSGEGCSSEAVGQLSGMSGLLFSAAVKYGREPLSAGEAMQLWIGTADDIDVTESREEGSKWYWSQPGFDQRFGYGRTNANTAVEWVKDGKIPPEVDVVRPYWFEVLYRDQVSAPVEIHGHVSARRANSYDYVVEWAPGVQPLDDAFVEVASETNIPPNEVSGAGEPLALLDVRNIDTTHEPDVDSPNGENQYTITVRVRATAHYGGDIGDVPGEMRRTYYVHSDPDLVKGFPLYLGDSGESSPKLADIDGDGVRDIVYATGGGLIHVLRITAQGPEPVAGFPFRAKPVDGLTDPPAEGGSDYRVAPGYQEIDPALAAEAFGATPAIADFDGNGTQEIVGVTYNGTIYVIGSDGKVLDGWPVRLPDVPSCPTDGTPYEGLCSDRDHIVDRGAFGSPVIEDMNDDGQYDIIVAGFDGKIHIYDLDGEPLEGWPVLVHYDGKLVQEPRHGRILTTPAVGDFNDDGIPDVVTGSNERLGQNDANAGGVYMIDGRGTKVSDAPWFPNWPVTMTSLYLFPLVAEGVTNAAVVGRFDGTLAAVAHGNASAPMLLPLDPGPQNIVSAAPPNILIERTNEETGEVKRGVEPTAIFGPLTKAFQPNTMFPLFSNPSLGDVDQDGVVDIIASGSSLSLAQNLLAGRGSSPGEHLLAIWSGKTGKMMPAAPMILEDYSFFNSHAVVDLNGDDYPEVVVGSGGYYLHAWDACGREPEGWPKFTGQWLIPTPAVGDLDGDGKLEVVTGTRSGWLYAWHTEGSADGVVEWESFHHDNRNTGNYEVPLEQGDRDRRAAEPLTLEMCEVALAADPAGLEPGGGCGCHVVGQNEQTPRGAVALMALLGLLPLRRRRRVA